jgi:two-component system cell cycle sensor histidine kinase/response regulator CckA
VKLPERRPRELPPFNVDLKVDRLERLLVNLASYSRQRMPSGGKMIFDLAPTQVDRQFIEKHPNVREGPHVILTVTEAAGAVDRSAPLGLRELVAKTTEVPDSLDKPGVDLSALQGLVRECGGHLWMEAAPPGDMMIKIHLPLRAA